MDINTLINGLYLYTGHIAVVLLGINVLLLFSFYSKLKTPFRYLLYFLILCLVTEISARICSYSGIKNNLPLLHLYTLGEFVLLSLFYKQLIKKPHFIQRFFPYFLTVGVLFIIANSLFIQSIFEFNPLAKTFVQIVIITFAVIYFYNIMDNQRLSPLIEANLRLINSSILVYYSGSLFIFMCNQIFFEQSNLYKIFWAFNAILNLIFQLLILWGISKVIFRKAPLS